MLLNILQCTGQPLTDKNYPAQSSAKVGKTSSRPTGELKVKKEDLDHLYCENGI